MDRQTRLRLTLLGLYLLVTVLAVLAALDILFLGYALQHTSPESAIMSIAIGLILLSGLLYFLFQRQGQHNPIPSLNQQVNNPAPQDENLPSEPDAQRRLEELDLINQINQTLLASVDMETTADAVLRNVKYLFDYHEAEINIWNHEDQVFDAHTVGDTSYKTANGNRYRKGEGFTGWLYEHRKPLGIPDIASSTLVKPRLPLADFPFRSFIGVPLIVGTDFMGTLELVHRTPHCYSQEDADRLSLVAKQFAIALNHAILFQENERHARVQTKLSEIASLASMTLNRDTLLKRIMEKTVDALDAHKGIVLLLNQHETELYVDPSGVVGFSNAHIDTFSIATDDPQFQQSVLSTGLFMLVDSATTDPRILPIYKPFVEKFELTTLVGVPLTTADTNIGEIYIANKEIPFTRQDVVFLSSVAVHFASAIMNSRLFERTQRNLADLSLLYRSTEDFSSSEGVNDVLTHLANRLTNVFAIDLCLISLYDNVSHTLTSAYETKPVRTGTRLSDLYHPKQCPITSAVIHSLEPCVIDVHAAEISSTEKHVILDTGYESQLLLPLVVRNQVIGLVELYAADKTAFDDDEINLVRTLANQAAVALQNVQRYAESDTQLNLRIQELSSLHTIAKELNSTLHQETIMQTLIQEAVQATEADIGNVRLYDPDSDMLLLDINVGWPDNEVAYIGQPSSGTNGIIGRVRRNKRSEYIPDVSLDPDYRPYPYETSSEMTVPILQAERVDGIINLESQKKDAFTPLQLKYVEALADQASIAIRNAQHRASLMEERSRAGQRLSQLARLTEVSRAFRANLPLETLLEEIAFAIQETVGFEAVLLSVSKRGHLYIVTGAGIPVARLTHLKTQSHPIAKVEALLQPQFALGHSFFIPVDVHEADEDRSYLVPIEIEDDSAKISDDLWHPGDLLLTPLRNMTGEMLGLLSVTAPHMGKRPTDFLVEILEIFAQQAATAIENTNLFQEVEHRINQLKLYSQISSHISAILNPTEILNEVVNLISNAFNYDLIQIYRPESRNSDHLVLQSRSGVLESERLEALPQTVIPINDQSLIGWVAIHQRQLCINNLKQDNRFLSHPGLSEIHSEIVLPLRTGTTVFGVLDIQHRQPDTFAEDDTYNLQALADQLAVATQNAQLFNDALVQEQVSADLSQAGLSLNETLETVEILDKICREAVSTFQVDSAFLWLVAGDHLLGAAAQGYQKELFVGQAVPLDNMSILGSRIAETKQAEFINEADHSTNMITAEFTSQFEARAVLGAPLISGGHSLGVLMLLDYQNPNRFDAKDQINASLLANQAAIAIVNARLFEQNTQLVGELEKRVEERTRSLALASKELRQERDRFNILYDIARQLTSSLDLEPILNQTLLLMGQSIEATKASILLISADNGNLIHRAALGRERPLPKEGQETRFKIGQGLAGYVLETMEPLIVPNLATCEHWIPDESLDEDDQNSALAIPLVSGYDGLGVILLFHTELDFFNDDHLNLVTAAAPMIATAISNANLFIVITEASERVGTLFSRVQAEANKNEAIIEAISDGVMVIDREQNIQLINPAMAAILNLDRRNLLEQQLQSIISPDAPDIDQRVVRKFYDIVISQQPGLTETEDGIYTERVEIEKKAFYTILTPVTFSMEHANQPSTLIVVRDISREAEIDRIKNEFISTVSHELRTPMTSIKGYLDLLVGERVGSLTEMQHRFLGIIQNNANRLTTLVNDILEISGLDAGQVKLEFSNIDLKNLIKNVIASFEYQIKEKNLSLTLNLPDNLPHAYADESRVTQVLYNLVGNATKYTHPDDCVVVTLTHHHHFLKIDVCDTGLGISEGDLQHIFERFYRAERDATSLVDGTGLGLPIAKMFVELMGGEIWVESTLGNGSTFSFTLPVKNDDLALDKISDQK